MKVRIRIPFYSTELGMTKRNEEYDIKTSLADGLLAMGLVERVPEEEKTKTAAKGKGRNTGT